MGGQVPNNLAIRLHQARREGPRHQSRSRSTPPRTASKFSSLLDRLGINQPKWAHLTNFAETDEGLVESLGGYPVLVRPSYVLSGAAMSVAHEPVELRRILERAKRVSPDHPTVMTSLRATRAGDRDRCGGRQRRARSVGHLRARRRRRRALGRRDDDAAAPVDPDSGDSPGPQRSARSSPKP